MSAYPTISPDKLLRLLGSPKGPALIDVRPEADFAADPRLIPGAVRRDAAATKRAPTTPFGRAKRNDRNSPS